MEDEDGTVHEVKVSAITEMYIRHYALMTRSYYTSFSGKEPERICFHILLKDTSPEPVQEKIAAAEGIDSIEFFDTVLNNFTTMVKSLDIIIITIIFSSMSLAAVVLSNLINVNISERQREIATLKVLGFRKNEVRSYIYKENNVLTLIGGIAGMPVGTLLHHYIMRTVEMDYIMFGRDVLPKSYLISLGLTFLFGIIVNRLMASRLDRIKMVESLKSVE
jgi:putative ABC transport system permease protein